MDAYSCSCVAGFANENCEVDVDECLSTPCANGAACTDSSSSTNVSADAFSCSCAAGYANGSCIYGNIAEYDHLCNITEGGLCDVDVDECASTPCLNSGNCSSAVHSYSCVCSSGYVGDNCENDIDECGSVPCQHGSPCEESSAFNSTVPPDTYLCNCTDGWEGQNCAENIDECGSWPCQNGGNCTDLVADYVCTCPSGWAGDHSCALDM